MRKGQSFKISQVLIHFPPGRRGYLTRNARKHAPPHVPSSYEVTTTLNNGTSGRLGNCMTYTSTMGRVISEDADVHISLMPDMADETIPDEKTTYDALLKIKALPEDMTSKRARKTKLGVSVLSSYLDKRVHYLILELNPCLEHSSTPSFRVAEVEMGRTKGISSSSPNLATRPPPIPVVGWEPP